MLRPGGRFAVSDVIADPDMDAATRADMQQWTGCIAGALTRDEFERALADAGLEDIEIRETHRVHEHAGSAIVRARKPRGLSRAMAAARRATAAYPLLLALGALDATGYSVIVPVAPAICRRDRRRSRDDRAAGGVVPGRHGRRVRARRRGWSGRVGARALLAGSLASWRSARSASSSAIRWRPTSRRACSWAWGPGGIWIGVTFDTLERWPGQEYLCMSRMFAAYSVGGLIGPALGVFGGIQGPFLAYLLLL